MRELILGTGMGFPIPANLQIPVIRQAGFDGFFMDWDESRPNMTSVCAGVAKRENMIFYAVHAPFGHVDTLWEEGDAGEAEVAKQIRCLEDSAAYGVHLVMQHAIIGMEKHEPTALGISRFGQIFDAAEKLGVTVALENTEGEEYLDALLTAFADRDCVRFCIDTGHEMCYNDGRDLISKYGNKLVCTHLNDNFGKTGGGITWLDDAHLLPFDGHADWEGIARRLSAVGYDGPLTFELTSKSKPERDTHRIYGGLDFDGFVRLAYRKAVQFRRLTEDFQ